ncbi:MAG: hypothetical protein DMF62_03080 [Acidobacteria bacterium]|nr:MAG: hypothetical protein DMF62_03080 [Acidobacteriota bacterium]
MPTFNDSSPLAGAVLMPEGDYALTVTKFEQRISTGQRTAGSALFLLEFKIEPEGFCTDCLVDSLKTLWRIDIFLKACGVKINKGGIFEFRADLAKSKAVQWINPIGLRCFAHVIVEEYDSRNYGRQRRNKVGQYLLNKEHLPRVETADHPEDEAEAAPTEDDTVEF